jgi:hypothetical protein
MRLLRRLSLRVIPVVALLLLVDVISYSSADAAGPDPSLCGFTSSRMNLPSGFPLNVCWDGSRVVIKNTTQFVVQISLSGDVGALSRTSLDGDAAGAAIAASTNPTVLPPEYQLTVPVGSDGASFTVEGNADNVTYAKLRALEGYIPSNVFSDYEGISGFVGELSDDSSEYAQCNARSTNFIESAACSASFAWNVNFAVDRLSVETGVQLLRRGLGALLSLINTALWAKDAVSSIQDLLDSPHTFSISAVSSPTHGAPSGSGGTGSSPPSPGGSGSSGGSGGVGSNASISVGWGSNPAPYGHWMDVTFTNFPTGKVTWYCVEGGTSYGPYSTTLTSSTETLTTNTCYDTEAGDTDYFTADGINSNTIPAD